MGRIRGQGIQTTLVADIISFCEQQFRLQGANDYLPPLHRFAVGIYQIGQGMSWTNSDVTREESMASACIHFIGALNLMGCPIENYVPRDLDHIPYEGKNIDYRRLMYCISVAQQQVFYHWCGKSTSRSKSRYNAKTLATNVAEVIMILLESIHKEDREEAIFNATEIMTGAL